jgi:hypothetical protein
MRVLMIAAALLAGCATTTAMTPRPDRRVAHLEQENQKIDESEHRCISEAMRSSDRQIASLAASRSASFDQQMQRLTSTRERSVFECRANADREREELSARERAIYQDRAQQERDRNSLITILTTSRPQ